MPKLSNRIISSFAAILLLGACSTASDRLNEKLVNQTTNQKFVTLQSECFAVANQYHGTLLPEGQPQRYLLSKICSDMEEQIKQVSGNPVQVKVSLDDFQKSYNACVKESDIYGSYPSGRRNHNTNHYQYHYQTQAICNAYRDMFTGLTGEVLQE